MEVMFELGSEFKSEFARNKKGAQVLLREGTAWAKAQKWVAARCV